MDPIVERLEQLERRVQALEQAALPGETPAASAPPAWSAAPRAVPFPARPTQPDPLANVPLSQTPPQAPRADAGTPRPTLPVLPNVVQAPPPAAPQRRAARERPAMQRVSAAPPATATPAGMPQAFESWFGSVVLGRAGIALLVLAAVYFAQLAYREVGDAVKVLSLYAWSGALLGAGHLLRRRVAPRYVGLFWGGGVAVAYIAGLAATLLYGLVSPTVGVVLLAGAAALGQVLAHRLRTEVLALVSLLGAAAAPVALGVVFEGSLFVLLYGAVLSHWAAFTETRYAWRGARMSGWAGAFVLGACWFFGRRGGPEGHAFLALHLYGLAVALPDLGGIWRGGSVAPRWLAAGATALGLLGAAGWAVEHSAPAALGMRGVTLLAGGGWTLVALALARRARVPAARHYVRMLAEVGGVLLVAGAALYYPGGGWAWPQWAAWTAAALVLLVLRRLTGAGEAAAALAAALSLAAAFVCGGLLAESPDAALTPLWARALALLLGPAAGLLLLGRATWARAAGLFGGALLLLAAATPVLVTFGGGWLLPALALPALWSLLAAEASRPRGDELLASLARVLALLLGLLWAVAALPAGRAAGWPAAADPFTLTALALGAVLFLLHLRAGPRAQDARGVLLAGALALPLLAGWRELTLVSERFGAGWTPACQGLYLATVGAALAWHRAGRARGLFGYAGLALLTLACGLAIAHAAAPAVARPFTVELLGVAALLLAAAPALWRAARSVHDPLARPTLGLLALVLAWMVAASNVVFPVPQAWLNLRALTGAALTGALAFGAADAARRGGQRALVWALGLGAFGLGFTALLLELVLATRDLPGALGPVLVSVYLALVAAALLRAGFAWAQQPLRVAALAGFGIVVAKVGLQDLAASSLPLRVLVSAILGVVLLASAYGYTRRRPLPDGEPRERP